MYHTQENMLDAFEQKKSLLFRGASVMLLQLLLVHLALHAALLVNNVKPGNEVITQALTFVATANAMRSSWCGAYFS